jgi:uncharacterized protein
MKYVIFLLLGIIFGITLYQAEIVSWFRIQEMFRFQSFHMYGVIGSAVVIGAIIVQIIKRSGMHTATGESWKLNPKDMSIPRYLVGGTFFGLGWALVGACPGPMFILVGGNASFYLIAVVGALIGTFTYGVLRSRLPH